LEKLNACDILTSHLNKISTFLPEMNLVSSSFSHNNADVNTSFESAAYPVHSMTVCMSDDFNTEVFDNNSIEVLPEENYTNKTQIMNILCSEMVSEKLFKNSNITVDTAVSHLLRCYVKHQKTKACLADELRIIKKILPQPNRIPSTVYKLFQYVLVFVPSCKIVKHFCCHNCQYYCGVERPILCPACNSHEQFIPFYELDIIEQLRYMFEQRNLAEVLDAAGILQHRDDNIITDITDGSEYKRVNSERGKYDVTLILSTDGACLKKSSKSTLWPVSFMIAEVPTKLRRMFMLCISVWYADIKPEMNTYLIPVCVRLRDSFHNGGFTWTHLRTKLIFQSKVTAPLVVADAPARTMIQNIHNFNGTYGCNMCEIKTYQTEETEGLRRRRIYKYQYKMWHLRTHERMIRYANLAEKSHCIVKGVKGRTIVHMLPGTDLGTLLFPEILHSVALGTVKQMIALWIEKSGDWNIKVHLIDIDIFLMKIKPPDTLNRLPRRLSLSKFWKGYEYIYWALFYSVFAIQPFLPAKYMQHWILFVIAINILLQNRIYIHPDLEKAEYLLQKFVQQFQDLYGERELMYNIHQMIHLGLSTRRWGPLFDNSAFHFENFIGTLSGIVHGSKHIGKELTTNIKISQGIQVLQNTYMIHLTTFLWTKL